MNIEGYKPRPPGGLTRLEHGRKLLEFYWRGLRGDNVIRKRIMQSATVVVLVCTGGGVITAFNLLPDGDDKSSSYDSNTPPRSDDINLLPALTPEARPTPTRPSVRVTPTPIFTPSETTSSQATPSQTTHSETTPPPAPVDPRGATIAELPNQPGIFQITADGVTYQLNSLEPGGVQSANEPWDHVVKMYDGPGIVVCPDPIIVKDYCSEIDPNKINTNVKIVLVFGAEYNGNDQIVGPDGKIVLVGSGQQPQLGGAWYELPAGAAGNVRNLGNEPFFIPAEQINAQPTG